MKRMRLAAFPPSPSTARRTGAAVVLAAILAAAWGPMASASNCSPAAGLVLFNTDAAGEPLPQTYRSAGHTLWTSSFGSRWALVNVGNNIQSYAIGSPSWIPLRGMTYTGLSGDIHQPYQLRQDPLAALDGTPVMYIQETGTGLIYLNGNTLSWSTIQTASLSTQVPSAGSALARLGDGRIVLCTLESSTGGTTLPCKVVSNPIDVNVVPQSPSSWGAYHTFPAGWGTAQLSGAQSGGTLDSRLDAWLQMSVPWNGGSAASLVDLEGVAQPGFTPRFFRVDGTPYPFSRVVLGKVRGKVYAAGNDTENRRFRVFRIDFDTNDDVVVVPESDWVPWPSTSPVTGVAPDLQRIGFAGEQGLLALGDTNSKANFFWNLYDPARPSLLDGVEDWWYATWAAPWSLQIPYETSPIGGDWTLVSGNSLLYTTSLPCALCDIDVTLAPGSLPSPGEAVTFQARAPLGSTLTWTWGDEGSEVTTSRTVTHAFATAGTHVVTLSVDDGTGGCVTTREVDVAGINFAEFAVPPYPTNARDLRLDDASTGTIASHRWAVTGPAGFSFSPVAGNGWGNGGSADLVLPATGLPACSGAAACYSASLTVGDGPLDPSNRPTGNRWTTTKSFRVGAACNTGGFAIQTAEGATICSSGGSGTTSCDQTGGTCASSSLFAGTLHRLQPACTNLGGVVEVDWGDGSTTTATNTTGSVETLTHEWETAGQKAVRLVADGRVEDLLCLNLQSPCVTPGGIGAPVPSNGVVGVPYATGITHSWAAGSWNRRWDFQLYAGSGCTNPILALTDLASPSATVPGGSFAPTTSYSWRVTPRNTACVNAAGPASSCFSYQTGTAPPCPVTAAFDVTVTGRRVAIANGSVNAQQFAWSFGDGTTSSEANPVHVYAADGVYTISLAASNAGCPAPGGSALASRTVEVTLGCGGASDAVALSATKVPSGKSPAVGLAWSGGEASWVVMRSADPTQACRPANELARVATPAFTDAAASSLLECYTVTASCLSGSPEVCDGLDNDCDGLVDEGLVAPTAVACWKGSVTNCTDFVESVWVGQPVAFDGSASSASGGGALSFAWTLSSRPSGSSATLASPSSAMPGLVADVAGTYVACLTVTDGNGCVSSADCISIEAKAAALRVEVTWDQADTDVDLHLVRDSMTNFMHDGAPPPGGMSNCSSALDCHWNCPNPNWGGSGTADNPRLVTRDADGFGPEVTVIESPAGGSYLVAVHYWCDHPTGTVRGAVNATARVWVNGVLAGQWTRSLTDHQRWWVADVNWAGANGTVTTRDQVVGTTYGCP